MCLAHVASRSHFNMTTKRAIELLRVSTAAQAGEDRASIPAQRTVNRRTALAHGLSIVRSIEMADVSGAAVLLAPEMRELISLMQDSEIHGVIAREFSRLMRPENFGDYALLQAFADTNTILYLPEGPIDFASKTGRLLGTIRAAIAGMERTEILERIWTAKEEKRKAGGFGQSKACLPYGVTFDGLWSYTADSVRVREAFRLLLSGSTSYSSIGRSVGIDPHAIRLILRNPIYTGWRVVDKKRDLSPNGKYKVRNGRQGDRRKITRAPDEVIRVKVIDEPLISEAEFNHAQRIMDQKKQNHWRMDDSTEHRFIYNGFLRCACGEAIYSRAQFHDYYVCRAKCGVVYQRRDRLDPHLNQVFTKRLSSPSFLKRHVIPAIRRKNVPSGNSERLRAQIRSLEGKRKRILDAYFEGVINGTERDTRIAEIERDKKLTSEMLSRESQQRNVTLDTLIDAFAPFVEFDLLNREDKRALLSTLTPLIVVANYEIKGMSIGTETSRTVMEEHAIYQGRIYIPLNLAA